MQTVVHIAYLFASVLFIFGLKQLSSVRKARRGNALASLAMLIAIVATLVDLGTINYTYIIAGGILGSLIGLIFAVRVEMTAMPQMVAIFNGMGGGASALVAISFLYGEVIQTGKADATLAAALNWDTSLTIGLSILIGGVTFTGSMIAFGKLQELIGSKPTLFKGQNFLNLLIVIAVLATGAMACLSALVQLPLPAGSWR